MKETTLVIMAAGLGSRFGKGIKQLAPVGPSGEIIMEYAIHDALEAGFTHIVFIIRRDLEKEFREILGDRVARSAHVSYVFQELSALPGGFTVPEGRTKPWGTGQAILSCLGAVTTPFAVINADDYYGKEAFVRIHDYLTAHADRRSPGEPFHFCMAGFILGNTLSPHGGVTRGICQTDENGSLIRVKETRHITRTPDGAGIPDGKGGYIPVDTRSHVSMNMWGFTPDFLDSIEKSFIAFLSSPAGKELTSEFLLPELIDQLILSGEARVTMLETGDTWFGVTYQEDRQYVADSFSRLVKNGVYPTPLFN